VEYAAERIAKTFPLSEEEKRQLLHAAFNALWI
jgi:hypothetical protein